MNLDLSPLWKAALLAAAVLALAASLAGYGVNACQHGRTGAHAEATITHRHDAQWLADSAFHFHQGQLFERAAAYYALKHHAQLLDSAALAWPADPARQ